jgi:hypothetical protein
MKTPTLLATFLALTASWRSVFPQQRSYQRAVRQGLGSLLCLGRRTLSRIIWTNGGAQRSWSAEYFLHARCQWQPQQLFQPLLERGLESCRGRLVGVAVDETRLRKTGRCIAQAFYQRDPLSPPFHSNLLLGLRFLQASLLLPLHRRAPVSARALPIRFQPAPVAKRPRRQAPAQEWERYRPLARRCRVSQRFVEMMTELRAALDTAGAHDQTLALAADGSFCNRTVFGAPRQRTELIARARKDAVLCERDTSPSRRFYAVEKFRPEQIRQDQAIPWQTTKIFYGGKRRKIRYKQRCEIYWQGGARRLPLRLFVVAPTAYRKRHSGRWYYRQPGYLLTTDLRSSAASLLQIYFDRWQIEVNHREEKDTLGVGQAQLWNPIAVPKQPVLAVASYSALLLASLLTFGPGRSEAYAALPKWRRQAKRPSCLDLITLLRQETAQHPELLAPLGLQPSFQALTAAAAA